MDLSVKRDPPTSQVGEAIMDLSSRGITVTRMGDGGDAKRADGAATKRPPREQSGRRSLRPRTEKSYTEAQELVVMEEELYEVEKPLPPIKELSPAELREKMEAIRKFREELRNEESKLVLLKRVRQVQAKENVSVGAPPKPAPPATKPAKTPAVANGGFTPPPGVTMSVKSSAVKSGSGHRSGTSSVSVIPTGRSSGGGAHSTLSSLMAAQQQGRRGSPHTPYGAYPLSAEVDIRRDSPTARHHHHQQQQQQQHRSKQPEQTSEQRQAMAKLSLRKQLEKTLLQIPPPKPPPPEMDFIPSGTSMPFVYMLGLEKVVDFIKKENRETTSWENFQCCQCARDFSSVWKWERDGRRVTCDECVTSNKKVKLKAEHTSLLKTAFVKAMQQEQEMDQQLAKLAAATPPPSQTSAARVTAPLPPTPETTITPIPAKREAHRPSSRDPHRPSSRDPHRPSSRSSSSHHGTARDAHHRNSPHHASRGGSSNSASNMSAADADLMKKLADPKYASALMNMNPMMLAAAAAMNQSAALAAQQQQMLHSSSSSSQQAQVQQAAALQHMLGQFNPLMYSYQMAMAQAAQGAAGSGSSSSGSKASPTLAELQQQYLLDMLPTQAAGLPTAWGGAGRKK